MLYKAFSAYGWFEICAEISVDSSVNSLNVEITQAIDLSVPSGHIMKRESSTGCSGKLQPYIETNNCVYIFLKSGYFQDV